MVKKLIKKFLNYFSFYKISIDDYNLFNKHYKYLLYTDFMNFKNSTSFDVELLKNSKSQLIQDLIVIDHFEFKKKGNFVELGASDGVKLSNSYLLEKSFNWTGVLIEPVKSSFKKLEKNRDGICLNKVIYNKKSSIIFQEDIIPELSTIKDYTNSDINKRVKKTEYEIETLTLNNIFNEILKTNYIDFLSLDTEGSEFIILSDLDHNKYRFGFICVEHNFSKNRKKIYELLITNGYRRIYERYSKWDDYYIPIL